MDKNKKILMGVSLVIVAGLILLVMAQVQYPSPFYGGVYLDGGATPAPIGTQIRAEVDGINTYYYVESEGLYAIEVEGLPGGGSEGNTITFYVDGANAGTGIFDSSQVQELNLVVGAGSTCDGYCSWVTKDTHQPCSSPYNGCVCDTDADGNYDKACCSGSVQGITAY